jgi:ketosteroid isomerase-like protein
LVEAYADAVFRRDAGAWAECWDEAAVWDLAGMRVEGRTAILALWEQAMQNFPFAAFFVQPGPLTLDGDRAHGLVYTHELLINSDGTRRQTVGRYDDAYVRTAPGWRFAGRSFSILQEFAL